MGHSVTILKFALPNTQHAPPVSLKPVLVRSIAGLRALDLRTPIARVALRARPAALAPVAVPVTAVNEHDRLPFRKDQVRCAREIAAMEPKAVASGVSDAPNEPLGARVFAADRAHISGALGGSQAVDHRHKVAAADVRGNE